MNYIDYTHELLDKYGNKDNHKLVLCPGFNCIGVYTNDPDIDLNEWIERILNLRTHQFDFIIMSRVFEHLPSRNIDYYLYNIYNIMKEDGLLIITVPDMPSIFERLREEYQKDRNDSFLINRLNFELFGEGEHHWDFHKTYTSESSMKYLIEREKLFKIEKMKYAIIETDLVPPYLEYHIRRL